MDVFSFWFWSDAALWLLLVLLAVLLLKPGTASPSKEAKQPAENHLQRFPLFDFLKGVAIVMVIALHSQTIAQMPSILGFAAYGLSVFIFVSGYLLAYRHPCGVQWRAHLQSVWKRVGAPYVLFTLVFGVLAVGLFHFPLSPRSILLDLLFGRAAFGYLYFIPLMVQFYLLFPLFMQFLNRWGAVPFLAGAFLLAAYSCGLYAQYNSSYFTANLPSLVFFGRYMAYFAAGMFATRVRKWPSIPSWAGLLFAGTLFVMLGMPALDSLLSLSMLRGLAFIALLAFIYHILEKTILKSTLEPFLSLGQHSIYVYLVHALVIFTIILSGFILRQLGVPPVALYLLTIIVVTGTSLGLAFALKRTMDWLFALCGPVIWRFQSFCTKRSNS